MVKRGTMRLCYASSSAECATCFPEHTSGKFFLRERLAKHSLEPVDAFVSPSKFLKDRYVQWGVAPSNITVIENLLPPNFGANHNGEGEVTPKKSGEKVRFGYFGQINPFKGANVLLDAVQLLSKDTQEKFELVIFGARLEEQSMEFQAKVQEGLNTSARLVSLFGPYRNDDVSYLMKSIDWMIIPSIWWENSPVVIQEAKSTRRPILASNIGGMLEKVRDGIDGLHFLAGSALDLASKIEMIIKGDASVELVSNHENLEPNMALQEHLALYDCLRPRGSDPLSLLV
jgi:glycosyltransferase involved in cell wall biosynthesis